MRTLLMLLMAMSLTVAAPFGYAKDGPAKPEPKEAEGDDFPTPAEIMKKIRERQAKVDAQPKVAFIDLAGPVREKPADFTLFFESSTNFRTLVNRFRQARTDDDVKAVLVKLTSVQLNLAQAHEIRNELAGIRKAGKPVYIYADAYDTIGYIIASAGTDVCLLEGGMIIMPGIALEAMFLGGTLEKIGVKADFIQIGEYKGADEQFTRKSASPELKGELSRLVDNYYGTIVSGIAKHRMLPEKQVKSAIDEAILNSDEALNRRMVDHIVDVDGLRALMAKKLKSDEVNILADYGKAKKADIDFSNPFALLSALTQRPSKSGNPIVAVVYVDGPIMDGYGGEDLFGGGNIVGSEDIREAMRLVRRDEDVKAVVIRIDSPGGSAIASEAMYQAISRAAAEKPMIMSVGAVAASGGYYVACAGPYIIADEGAIVGSIGVVSGKLVLKGLFDWAGIGTETFARGENATLFSSDTKFTERQRAILTKWMGKTYDQFTSRVMATRKGKIKNIDKVARGRIFMGREALKNGMVDELGGINQAIAAAAAKAELKEGDYDVTVYPQPKTLADLLSGGMGATMPNAAAQHPLIKMLPAEHRAKLARQAAVIKMLDKSPILLVAPFGVSVK